VKKPENKKKRKKRTASNGLMSLLLGTLNDHQREPARPVEHLGRQKVWDDGAENLFTAVRGRINKTEFSPGAGQLLPSATGGKKMEGIGFFPVSTNRTPIQHEAFNLQREVK